jgi:tetratricopeptide (TPR) repeat protein
MYQGTPKWITAPLIAGALALMGGLGVAQDQTPSGPARDQEAWATCAGANKNADAVIDACTRILREQVARVQAFALFNRGLGWKASGEPERAIADFNEAIAADPSLMAAYAERGDVYRDNDRCQQAIADYDQVLRLFTSYAAIYVSRGICLMRQNAYDRALADFEAAIRFDPNNAKGSGALAWSMKGRLRLTTGDLDQAMADYDAAIRLDPRRASLYLDRGDGWSSKGNAARALADYEQAIKLAPNDPAGYAKRGDIYRATGEYQRAIEDYERAIARQSADVYSYGSRGLIRFYLGDFAGAVDDLVRVTQARPDPYAMLMLYLSRARAGNHTGREELARHATGLQTADWPYPVVELYLERRPLSAVERAADSPAKRCEAQFYVGQWHLLRGERAPAAKALQAAADTCPKSFIAFHGAKQEIKRLNP